MSQARRWRRWLRGLITGLALLTAAPLGAQAPPDAYRLGPGDQIRIDIAGREDLSGSVRIGADGIVTLPVLGQLAAAPLTVAELRGTVAAGLAKRVGGIADVSVTVLLFRPFSIQGEVNEPGIYDYIVRMTVANAIAMARGLTKRAQSGPVLLTRIDQRGAPVRYRAFGDTPVFPGDVLEVLGRAR